MVQQMGIFYIKNSSECNKPRREFGGTTPANILAHEAPICCKSKRVDQSVCKVDTCVSAMAFCLALHNDFEDAEEKLTDPRAMDTDEDGNRYGSCSTAILNRVEGELCCTAGMKQLAACVPKEVGDYTLCKDSWNNAFEPDFYATGEAVMEAFQPGGYCMSETASTTTERSRSIVESTTYVHTTTVPPTPTSRSRTSMLLPCDQASDFEAQNTVRGSQTCEAAASLLLPSSAAECSEKPDGGATKAEILKMMYSECCKPGSKPNSVCGFQPSTSTPCENKDEGEFLPEAR